MPALSADWLRPSWDAPPNVGAAMSLRAGGCSAAPFDSFNLGAHVGDRTPDVARNRAAFCAAIPARPMWLRQVHGTAVVTQDSASIAGAEADACVTSARQLACVVLIADCMPVFFADRRGSAVAVAHAGWRGLSGMGSPGILESTYAAFRSAVKAARTDLQADTTAEPDVDASDTLIWLGPCIGQPFFEVGAEVRQAFVNFDAVAEAMIRPGKEPGKFHADLQGLARQRLKSMGIRHVHGNDGSAAWCTFAERSRFFSHRRDHLALGGSGRMAAAIWLR